MIVVTAIGSIICTPEYLKDKKYDKKDNEGLMGNEEGLCLKTIKIKARLAVEIGR